MNPSLSLRFRSSRRLCLVCPQTVGLHQCPQPGGGLGGWKKAESAVVTGSMPEAPAVLNSAAIVEDQALFEMLNGFLTGLPEGFYSVKNDKLNEELG